MHRLTQKLNGMWQREKWEKWRSDEKSCENAKRRREKLFSFDVAAWKKHRKCFSSFSFCHDRDFFWFASASVLELQEIYLDIRWERELEHIESPHENLNDKH